MYHVAPIAQIPRPPVRLVPVTCLLAAQLGAAAAADGHALIQPTHAVLRGETPVGYVSLGRVAMFYAWMDTQRATARDSAEAWALAEAELVRSGHPLVCLPCAAKSPFAPFVARRGYQPLGPATFHLKDLTKENYVP